MGTVKSEKGKAKTTFHSPRNLSVTTEDIEESRVAISITKGSGSKLKKGRPKKGAAYNGEDEHEAEVIEGGQGSGDEDNECDEDDDGDEDGPLNADNECDEDDDGDEGDKGHEVEDVNEGAELEANEEDDTTDSEFVDSGYSLEDDDRRIVDDTIVDTMIGNAKRGEGVRNQHPKEVIDARDVEDTPLNDEREYSDGLHSADDSEANGDDPKFEKGLKFRDAAQLRETVWSHSIKHGAFSIKLKRNEKWNISAKCEKNCPWRLYASRMYNEDSMQVKTYVGKHECPRIWREKPNCKMA
ncbi:hypothetical protein D8674_020383 [Pyrus ussuriensis x Pyrus communis]|uniref:Transposase MuDR plant domain-containing protein n=1 Tax=Pyrus ussuriensis x Pyrus communis TaxID=2448454 RepID=A0A5N5HFX9_9ROSA|nr:hypothetical protein D8674_020383 [Pyrus ussuriensis x Pyrus communis]